MSTTTDPINTHPTDPASFRAAIDRLLPVVSEQSGATEEMRRMGPELVASFRDVGLFRMLLPRSHGGLGIDYPTSVEVLRSIARADGSVGWSLMINTESPQLFALLPESTFEAFYAAGPDITIAGAFAPSGTAIPVDGGFEVSGRWQFASACEHSDYLFANCVVPGVAPDAPGSDPDAPVLRCVVAPRDRWTIHDTWDTLGLRGTGSHDISLDEAFIADDHVFDLFGGRPFSGDPGFATPVLQFSMHIGAVALGIAEGAHRAAVELATTGKRRLYGRTPLAESEPFQQMLGRTEADLRAAHALLMAQANEFWDASCSGAPSITMVPRVRQAVTWIVSTAVAVVDQCHRAGGGGAARRSSPLERRMRDIHTLSQHAAVQEAGFANSGALLVGIVPEFRL